MSRTIDTAFLNGLRVLVTGASGFIGSHLCARLTGLGAEVHGVSRTTRNNGSVFRWWQVALDDEIATRSLVETVAPDYYLSSRQLCFGFTRIRACYACLAKQSAEHG